MNLLYTYSFWDFCSWGWFSQCTIFKSGLFRADFQKECVFWVDSFLLSTKTTFFLRILLVRVVFSMHHFQIWTFQSRFPKRMWFLSRFRLNLPKNHVLFENSAREGGFLKAPESRLCRLCRLCRFIDFHNECGFWVDLGLRIYRILWA